MPFKYKPPPPAPVAAPKLNWLGGGGNQYQYNGVQYSPDHYGVIQEGIGQGMDKSPYWEAWLKDLAADKLQGSPQYFSGNYAQQAQGADAFKKQQEAEQAKIQGQYGDLQGQLQENMNQRGLGRSGLMTESLGRLAGAEQGGLDDLTARVNADRQRFNQGLQLDWQNQREDDKARKERKRSRKYGVTGSILGGLGAIGGTALGGPAGGMFGSQLGSSILGGGY